MVDPDESKDGSPGRSGGSDGVGPTKGASCERGERQGIGNTT